VNYGVIGLIQLELGSAETADLSYDDALKFYDKYIQKAKELMRLKIMIR
jgi:hypothetical protein